jgi:hypothetical protein
VPQFYPSKFVLITEILDTFGRLVYDRIFEKATYIKPGTNVAVSLPSASHPRPGLRDWRGLLTLSAPPYPSPPPPHTHTHIHTAAFTPDMVSDVAKETCKNWFFKIASIRELVPRLYVELAILRCYNFLAKDDYSNALQRLCSMIRGIGNPLVATYCRAYLCRKVRFAAPFLTKRTAIRALARRSAHAPGPRAHSRGCAQGMEVAPGVKKHLLAAFYDFTFTYTQIRPENVQVRHTYCPAASAIVAHRCGSPMWRWQDTLTEFNITFASYLDLYTPAVDWILQCVAHNASKVTASRVSPCAPSIPRACCVPISLSPLIQMDVPAAIGNPAGYPRQVHGKLQGCARARLCDDVFPARVCGRPRHPLHRADPQRRRGRIPAGAAPHPFTPTMWFSSAGD